MKDNVFNNSATAFITFGLGVADDTRNDSGDLVKYTRDQIKTVFLNELRKFGQTTSLEVKNALRLRNFYADQRDVSQDLRDLSVQLPGVESYSNGTFITYYLDENQMDEPGKIDVDIVENAVNDAQTDAVNDAQTDAVNDGPAISYTRRNGEVMIAKKNNALAGDWVCTCANDYSHVAYDELYFDPKWTRDQVRAAYASLNKVQNNDVRASRVK